jgi:hypothetical protein
VLDVSSQDSPLLNKVKPAAGVFGDVAPINVGPTLIKPVEGVAVLSAKYNPGSPGLLLTANSATPNRIGNGLS